MLGQAERLFELRNLSKISESSSNKKNIVAFTSGKGGTGKTFLSLNIAYTLSQQNKKVLFIDLDLNFANSNILLNEIPSASINDFLKGKKLFKDVITKYIPDFHLIFGESGKDLVELKSEMIFRLYNSLVNIKDNYDIIIIDTASGGQKELISLLSLLDYNIIVSTSEPTSVMDAYVIVKLLNAEKYEGTSLVIINKSQNEKEAIEAFNNIRSASIHFLGCEVEYLGCVNNDPAVSKSIIEQELLVQKYPSFSVSKSINKLAFTLADIIQVANIHQREISTI